MGIGSFIESTKRVLRVASKPSRTELWMLVRVTAIGIAIVGGIGFMIKVLFWFVGLGA
ncbi:MAG: protein translocase SEC61 complex subunit gamma [Candidatus Bathyarchaeota archaeon]|nr:protein translocase SEC61 complex subunit gamma [Candidatus Bathyarchaeota archaeon]